MQFKEPARLAARSASVLQVGGFRPSNNLSASNFGRRPLARPAERWPAYQGEPMLFVCQLNLAQAPSVPPLLQEFKLLTLFVAPDTNPLKKEGGEDWVVRNYKTLLDLSPLTPPEDAPHLERGFEARWEEASDQPVDEDGEGHLRRTKVGGHPSHIQGELWWELECHPARPEFCWQVDSEPKVQLSWGDGGMVYLARGTAPGFENRWYLDWQCY